jgi:hypothetical protein
MMLTPIEKSVLTECQTFRSLGELQLDLSPLFDIDSVRSSVRFLRRRRLLDVFADGLGEPLYHRSELGERVLAEQRSKERAIRRRRHLHLADVLDARD